MKCNFTISGSNKLPLTAFSAAVLRNFFSILFPTCFLSGGQIFPSECLLNK